MMQARKLFTTATAAAALLFAATTGAFAQSEHESHHPGGDTAPASPAPQAQPEGAGPMQKEGMGGMMGGKDMPMMKMMQEMHGKIMGGGMATPDAQWHMMRGVGPMSGLMSGDCPVMGGMMRGEDMPSFAEGRIAFLKAELAITDAQKGLWDAHADALRANFRSMHDARQTMKGRMSDMTTVERLHAQLTLMEARVQVLTEVKPSLTALYGALSADQKAKADQLLTPLGCMM